MVAESYEKPVVHDPGTLVEKGNEPFTVSQPDFGDPTVCGTP